MHWAEFVETVTASRECGEVLAFQQAWTERPDPGQLAEWLTACGFELPSGLPALELSRAEAAEVICDLMQYDLAYGAPLVSFLEAEQYGRHFLAFHPSDTSFLTNGTITPSRKQNGVGSWNPLTTATFDAGVLAVGRQLSSIFWVTDED